jgi:2-octaprenyl-6-methoxyphenol hydroxylase
MTSTTTPETAAPSGSASDVATEIAVVGGGAAGWAAALMLARAGRAVTLVTGPAGEDRRTTALFGGSMALLEYLGLWPALAAAGAEIAVMRLVDDTGRLIRAPETSFDAAEIGRAAFGVNLRNADLVATLAAAARALANLTVRPGRVTAAEPGADAVALGLDDGSRLVARLAVAADGRRSLLREAAGLKVASWSYPQSALVADVAIETPHFAVCTEFHGPNGPYVLVPLPGDAVSVVLVEAPGIVQRLAEMSDEALADELTRRAHRLLGRMTLVGPRQVFPLSGQIARRFADRRVALVGEAAHVFPPIGAQGLNLGLRDVAHLAEAVTAAGPAADPGGPAVLAGYDRRRRLDVASRTFGVDVADRALLADAVPVQALRAGVLALAGGFPPLRRFLMREAMVPGLGAPKAMRAAAARG